MNTVSRDFYALNLTDTQADKLISKIEADVTAQLHELQSKQDPLTEAEQYYHSIRDEVERLTTELNDNKSLLEALVRFKTNKKGIKEIRVLRTTSNVEQREKHQRYFKWIQMAVQILTDQDRFMSGDELFNSILKLNQNIEKSVGGDKGKLGTLKNTTLHNFIRTCNETRKNGRGKLIDYNDKFGLFDWVMDDYTPDPNHIKAFIHTGGNLKAKLYLES